MYMEKIQEVYTIDSRPSFNAEPLEKVHSNDDYNVFANERQHSEQHVSINNTCVVENVDSNVIPDSSDMCDNDNQVDQNAEECDDERVVLANLIANLKLDTDENKKIHKQLKKVNTSLSHELQECKSALEECKSSLENSNRTRDRCIIALQNKKIKLEKYKTYHDRTIEHDILERKLKDTLELLAQKEHDIKEGLKIKANEISVVKEKHDELVKQSLLTKSSYESFVKEKNKVIKDLKLKEENDLDKLIALEKQLKNLNEIVYKRNQSIQTIHIPKVQHIMEDQVLQILCTSRELNLKSHVDAYNELQCLYLHKVKECECLEEKLSKQTKNVSKEVYNGLLQNFAKLEKHSISLELALQQCQEQIKNDTVYKQNGSTVFLKRREQYFKIQDLKAQLQDKNIVIRVIHNTSVSRPQLKSTQMKDKVMQNNSRVKFKKTEVEDHHSISSISNKTKPVTARNDSLKSRTSNVNVVCATCEKYVFNSNHDAYVSRCINDVNARTKKPKIVQLILFIVDSGCTKHMTGNLKLLCNFVEKYLGTVRFGNDQFAPILGYGDLAQGNIKIKMFYYVEGLNHNLFSVGQFCDADLEVAFRKSTCFVRDLQGNDLLTGSRGSDLYTISLQETSSPTLICFLAKVSLIQAWLWHQRLSHLNFDAINLISKKDIVNGLPKLKYAKDQLCSTCELSKAKRSTFKTKTVPSSKGRLNLLHMDLCGPMRIESINRKKYILVIVDEYSRYTWTLFLRARMKHQKYLNTFSR
ncbi:retrovirus-related pol polyprotein from transposon TNT 1-94 [Tanacetum coccineum]